MSTARVSRAPAKPMPRAEAALGVPDQRPPPHHHWFGVVPAYIEPSRPIRYLGSAVVIGLLVAGGVDAGLVALAHAATHTPGVLDDMNGGAAWWLDHLTLGRVDADATDAWGDMLTAEPFAVLRRIVGIGSALIGLATGIVAAIYTSRPQITGMRHVRGPRLIEGQEAIDEARRYSVQKKTGDGQGWPLFSMPLLRECDIVLPKDVWSRGALVYGSPGAGKTVAITPIVQSLVQWPRARALVWDAKSDYTAAFFGLPGVAILSPYDARSVVWDVGEDCRTQTEALALAAVLASGGGTNGTTGAQSDFFTQAAQTVLVSALETIQAKHGTRWGWDTFATMFTLDRQALHDLLVAAGHPEITALIGTNDAKSSSIMATVGNALSMTRTLGRAWPFDEHRPEVERFSVRAWCADEYNTKRGRHGPRVLMVKPDDFAETIGRCLVAMVNIIAQTVVGLPDNERGRCLAIVCDEIAALKSRIQIADLVAVGRSKGIVPVLGLQDLHQLVPIYGPDTTKAMASMVGLHIIGRTNMGATRQEIADHIGMRVVAIRPHGLDPAPAREDAVPVVPAPYISHDLGPFGRAVETDKKGRKHTRAQGVRLLVHGLGPNVLRLEWPIAPLPRRALGKVPAAWAIAPIGPAAPSVESTAAPESTPAVAEPVAPEQQPMEQADIQPPEHADAVLAPASAPDVAQTETVDMGWAG